MRERPDGSGPIREPVVEGIFYPENKDELTRLIASLMSHSPAVPAEPVAIVTPHASLSYSGETMSAAFKRAAGLSRDVVVLLGPVHRDEESVVILPESQQFRTPLGTCYVEEPLRSQLLESNPAVIEDDIPHLEEHCLEVQLPFVQYLFPDATILPILMGSPATPTVTVLAEALARIDEAAHGSLLYVVSSNMTGYREAQTAKDEATRLIHLLLEGKWKEMMKGHQERRLSTHGVGCLAAFLSFAADRFSPELLSRQNSFPQNPDVRRVVEYASFAFFTSD